MFFPRVSPAEATTPRPLSFSTTRKGELPFVKLLLVLSLQISVARRYTLIHFNVMHGPMG